MSVCVSLPTGPAEVGGQGGQLPPQILPELGVKPVSSNNLVLMCDLPLALASMQINILIDYETKSAGFKIISKISDLEIAPHKRQLQFA